MTQPLVSVIIPAFNVESCIGRAIHSVQIQSLQDFEIIVVDDGSSDGTIPLVQKMAAADARIRVAQLPQNGGPSVARNKGLDLARGTWIAILDADDAFKPARLKTMLAKAMHFGWQVIADNNIFYDQHADTELAATDFTMGADHLPINPLPPRSRLTLRQLGHATLGKLKVIMNRDFLNKHGIRYPDGMRYGEDFILYAECMLCGAAFGIIRDAFYVYTEPQGGKTRHKSALSRTKIDPSQICVGIDALFSRYGAHMRTDLVLLLRARARHAHTFHLYLTCKNMVLDRQFGKALGLFVSHPPLWGKLAISSYFYVKRIILDLLPHHR